MFLSVIRSTYSNSLSPYHHVTLLTILLSSLWIGSSRLQPRYIRNLICTQVNVLWIVHLSSPVLVSWIGGCRGGRNWWGMLTGAWFGSILASCFLLSFIHYTAGQPVVSEWVGQVPHKVDRGIQLFSDRRDEWTALLREPWFLISNCDLKWFWWRIWIIRKEQCLFYEIKIILQQVKWTNKSSYWGNWSRNTKIVTQIMCLWNI